MRNCGQDFPTLWLTGQICDDWGTVRHVFARAGVEAGIAFPLVEGLSGDLGFRYRHGPARATAKIDVTGYGVSTGATWREAGCRPGFPSTTSMPRQPRGAC